MPSRFEPSHHDHDDDDDAQRRRRPQTWRERHALKILGCALIASLATVIFAQVAC